MKVHQQCKVPLSIGKYNKDTILSDAVSMDATHILLGRPWQNDQDVTYKGKLNQYVIQVKDRRIVLLPLNPSQDKKKEKPNLMIQGKAELEKEMKEVGIGFACFYYWLTTLKKIIPRYLLKFKKI